MRWLDTPPCVPLDLDEATTDRLVLRGPTTGARAVSGVNAALEITKHAHRDTTAANRDDQVYEYRLVVVTRGGHATPIDTHGPHAQAELRRQAVSSRLPR